MSATAGDVIGIALWLSLAGIFLLQAAYLFRLWVWVRKHPRRQATGGTDSPKACP